MTARPGERAENGAPARVVYAPPDAWSADEVVVSDEEHHHLTRVLRRRPGDRVEAVDGAGRRAVVEIAAIGRASCRCAIVSRSSREDPPAVPVRLAPGLVRSARMDWIVEKAAELGVVAVTPVVTERSIGRPVAGRLDAMVARWERIALSAMKQSRRARRPVVEAPVSLDAFLARLGGAGRLIVPWEGAEGPALRDALRARPVSTADVVTLLVGPEGGLAESEAARIHAAGGELVRLQSAILRAETAALAALSALLYEGGGL